MGNEHQAQTRRRSGPTPQSRAPTRIQQSSTHGVGPNPAEMQRRVGNRGAQAWLAEHRGVQAEHEEGQESAEQLTDDQLREIIGEEHLIEACRQNPRHSRRLGFLTPRRRNFLDLVPGWEDYTPGSEDFALAVARYQHDNSLEVDGQMGPDTWRHFVSTHEELDFDPDELEARWGTARDISELVSIDWYGNVEEFVFHAFSAIAPAALGRLGLAEVVRQDLETQIVDQLYQIHEELGSGVRAALEGRFLRVQVTGTIAVSNRVVTLTPLLPDRPQVIESRATTPADPVRTGIDYIASYINDPSRRAAIRDIDSPGVTAIIHASRMANTLVRQMGLNSQQIRQVLDGLRQDNPDLFRLALLHNRFLDELSDRQISGLDSYRQEFTGWYYSVARTITSAVGGEFVDDPNMAGIVADTAIGLIPVFDQITDARDIAAHLYKLTTRPGEVGRPMRWLGVGLSLIGVIPEVGSAIRGVFRLLMQGARRFGDRLAGNLGEIATGAYRLLQRTLPNLTTRLRELHQSVNRRWASWVERATEIWNDIGRRGSGLANFLLRISRQTWDRIIDAGRRMLPSQLTRAKALFDSVITRIGSAGRRAGEAVSRGGRATLEQIGRARDRILRLSSGGRMRIAQRALAESTARLDTLERRLADAVSEGSEELDRISREVSEEVAEINADLERRMTELGGEGAEETVEETAEAVAGREARREIGEPSARQTELFERSRSMDLDELFDNPDLLNNELREVSARISHPIAARAEIEVTLPNGHTWRRHENGRWCRNFEPGVGEACIINLDVDVDEILGLNWEEGMSEGGEFIAGEMNISTRMRRPRSAEQVPSFNELNLTADQLNAVRRISGQFLSTRLRTLWREIIENNPRAQTDMEEVRRLFNQNRIEESRRLARAVYNRARSRFWRKVRKDVAAKTELRGAGLRFAGSRGSAPFWEFPDGYKERLTLEHSTRVLDDPRRAVDSDNFQLVPFRENVNTLEWIRSLDEFIQ